MVVRSIKHWRLTIAIGVLSTASCSTTPALKDLTPVPRDRVLAYQVDSLDTASISILRDRAFAGGALAYQILVDGTLAARIRTGEKVTFFVPPGERIIEVRHPSPHFGAVGDSSTVNATAGAAYFFRINSDIGQIKLLRTTVQSASPGP